MGKKKKTREQKIIADLRNQLAEVSPSYSLKTEEYPKQNTKKYISPPFIQVTPKAIHVSYQYLYHDLTKTGILTLGIVAAQIILFFLLKNHIIKISMLNF